MRYLQDDKADMDVCRKALADAREEAEVFQDAFEADRSAEDAPLTLADAQRVAEMVQRDAFADAAIRLGYERLAESASHEVRRCECPEPGVCGHRPWCGWVRHDQPGDAASRRRTHQREMLRKIFES